jgi:LAO/AO transport system kinase
MDIVEKVLNGDRLALARILTKVENDEPSGREALDKLFAHTGKAHLVGITGSPGTGKSSLANQLAKLIRKPTDQSATITVAVVAIDPTSPFTGGAILGDRVRMRDLHGDEGIFIRSMASRGALGGIARATAAMVQVLDAAGFEMIFIETVGAGQAEVEIARLAHTTIVVEAPGLGDEIQAIKAGILEIADILVVNKADLPGAENAERALKFSLELAHPTRQASGEIWEVPVLKTQSLLGEGIKEVVDSIKKHGQYLRSSGEWVKRDRDRLQTELETLVQMQLMEEWRKKVDQSRMQMMLKNIGDRKISPYQAVKEIV